MVARNVAALKRAVKPPTAKEADADAERARSFWSEDELRCFLEHVRPHRLYAPFLLAASTGMRRGEVLGLRWQDVDFENRRLVVRQTLIAPRYELHISRPKSDKLRVIDLDAPTLAVLRAHKVRQAEERLAFGRGYDALPADDLVFRNEDGSPIVPHLFLLAFATEVKRAGVRKIHLHDLRHTHASLLGRAGAHPKVVQERLGHPTRRSLCASTTTRSPPSSAKRRSGWRHACWEVSPEPREGRP